MRFRKAMMLVCSSAVCLLMTAAWAFAARGPGGIAEHRPESYAMWLIRSLGLTGLLTLAASFAVFAGACVVVMVARRPAVIAAYLVFVPLPALLGFYGALKGNIAAFSVMSMADVEVPLSQVVGYVAETLTLPAAGMMGMFPSYLICAVGLFLRVCYGGNEAAKRSSAPPHTLAQTAAGK